MNDLLPEIICDTREINSGIPAILIRDPLFAIKLQQLKAGDYLVKDLIIERKTFSDLQNSIKDGRLFSQLWLIKSFTGRKVFIIEGKMERGCWLAGNCLEGLRCKIAAGMQIPVLTSKNQEETARLIKRMAIQLFSVKSRCNIHPDKKRKFDQMYLLSAIPGIGIIRAKALIGHFGTLSSIFSASTEQLAEVSGIGKTSAAEIKKLLDYG